MIHTTPQTIRLNDPQIMLWTQEVNLFLWMRVKKFLSSDLSSLEFYKGLEGLIE